MPSFHRDSAGRATGKKLTDREHRKRAKRSLLHLLRKQACFQLLMQVLGGLRLSASLGTRPCHRLGCAHSWTLLTGPWGLLSSTPWWKQALGDSWEVKAQNLPISHIFNLFQNFLPQVQWMDVWRKSEARREAECQAWDAWSMQPVPVLLPWECSGMPACQARGSDFKAHLY